MNAIDTDLLFRLCAVDSTSGTEDRLLPELTRILESEGARVETQPVAEGRTNVLATWGTPILLFSTHLDTVPPFLPPRLEGHVVFGRGTCDAKGQIVAHLAAIRRLRALGLRDVGFLGVVDEELSSLGAKAASALKPRLQNVRAVINGEPTENRLATGQRGILSLRLACRGVACHSGSPENGRNAAWPLLDWLQRVRALEEPLDTELGPEIWNLGLLRAGRAPNIVPDQAEAVIMARTLPASTFTAKVRGLAPPNATLEILAETPADRFPSLPGFPSAAVPFGSDAPRLRDLAQDRRIVLVGPGSIHVAHTENEHLRLEELAAGIDLLVDVARSLTA